MLNQTSLLLLPMHKANKLSERIESSQDIEEQEQKKVSEDFWIVNSPEVIYCT